jgi:hypothetical protein
MLNGHNHHSEEGINWWQKGSDFEHDVRAYVEAEDGKLEFRPFIWDAESNELVIFYEANLNGALSH